jgi:beta-N-acetylhexosaminidase
MPDLKQIGLILIFTLVLFCLPAASFPARAQQPADPVAELMSRMSVEDKVGQLFLVPFSGMDANPGSEVWQLVNDYKVGGIILLAANSNFNNDASAPRQIAELSNQLKTTAFNTNGLPLFIAIDHEGDNYPYTRLTGGVSPIPSQMAIGATWDTTQAEAVGQLVGQELSAMGINLLLGPNLDVLNDPRPTGRGDIGIRVFGGDPYWVGNMGRAYIRGVHRGSEGHLATVAKHFPGHGGSDRLPDNEVATVDKSLQELRRIELPPFFHATADIPADPLGVTDALMSSHIRYRGFQGDIRQFTAPISFDAEGMRTLITLPEFEPWRDDGGLIISDALGVPAVRKHFDPSLESFPHRRIAKDAFLAGNDVLSLVQFDLKSIWSNQFANIKDTIFFFRTEYLNNPGFAAQVDASVERILRLKLRLYPELTLAALNVDTNRALQVAGQPQPKINDIARKSLTLLYPLPEEFGLRLPEPPRTEEKILIISDTRYNRECFQPSCQPKELHIPREMLRDTILRLYGPGATGQIQPENIKTISFSELKHALGGSIVIPSEEATVAADESEAVVEQNRAIQLTDEEVGAAIQEADWRIFAAVVLNLSRYPDSDALKLFLAQESGTLRNKKTVVLAFNAPYYLDTTEVTKLSAYFGMYSKTLPHVEAAIRALFRETEAQGASPVSVEGIGYELVDVLAPDPDQPLPVEITSVLPKSGFAR